MIQRNQISSLLSFLVFYHYHHIYVSGYVPHQSHHVAFHSTSISSSFPLFSQHKVCCIHSLHNRNVRNSEKYYFQTSLSMSSSSSSSSSKTRNKNPSRNGNTKITTPSKGNANIHQNNSRTIAVSALLPPKSKKSDFFPIRRLETDPSYQNLPDGRDRAFARLLVATVERRMGQIDAILGQIASVYPPKKGKHAEVIQSCLRIGAAQLLFLDTPPHAAIKETVDVLKKYRVPEPMIKFVNAVLRSITRESKENLLQKHSSSTMNIAPWLIQDWETNWGIETTKLISEQLMKEPCIDVSVKLPYHMNSEERLTQLEKIQSQLDAVSSQSQNENDSDSNSNSDNDHDTNQTVLLPHGMIRTKKLGGAVHSWPLYEEGVWWIQDASSALPAIALCNGLAAQQQQQQQKQNKKDVDFSQLHVVDMCSAPGGKCAQLLSAGMGHVTAIEANARRSRRLHENLERLGFTKDQCTVVVSQGQEWLPSNNSDDKIDSINGILVDVPCSATGTGSKRPDVLRKDPDVLDGLLQTQEALANHCADNLLQKGGIMVYATCSLLKRESEDQVHKLISRGQKTNKENKDVDNVGVMETLPFVPGEIPGFDGAIDENGWLRVLPGMLEGELESCDGFFVARLIKVN